MKIKLGKLPDVRSVKVTVVMPAKLKAKIDRYAEFYSKTWTHEMDAIGLIPHILIQFLATDRAFLKHEKADTPKTSGGTLNI